VKNVFPRIVSLLFAVCLLADATLAAALGQQPFFAGPLAMVTASRFAESALSPTEGAAKFGALNLSAFEHVYELTDGASAFLRGSRHTLKFFRPAPVKSDPGCEEKVLSYLKQNSSNGYTADVLSELFHLEGDDVNRQMIVLALNALHNAVKIEKIYKGRGRRGAMYSRVPDPLNLKNSSYGWSKDPPTKEVLYEAVLHLSQRFGQPVSLTLIRFELRDWRSFFEDDREHLAALAKKGRVMMTNRNPKKYYVPGVWDKQGVEPQKIDPEIQHVRARAPRGLPSDTLENRTNERVLNIFREREKQTTGYETTVKDFPRPVDMTLPQLNVALLKLSRAGFIHRERIQSVSTQRGFPFVYRLAPSLIPRLDVRSHAIVSESA
jgi:hypothetical protein